jgi:cell wall-associated NlpC family hydrolase
VARSWKDTPFHIGCRARGPHGGVDCVNFIHAVLSECGLPIPSDLPSYSLDRGSNSTNSQLLRWVLDHQDASSNHALLLVPPQGRIIPGDLFALRTGIVDHHLAIALLGGEVAHAIRDTGVVIHSQNHPRFQENILYVLRLFEQGDVSSP